MFICMNCIHTYERQLQFEELREEEKHWCDWSEKERERLPFALHRANLGGNNISEHFGMI